jgi:hypothetical protein
VPERLKGAVSKTVVLYGYPGFESLPLRFYINRNNERSESYLPVISKVWSEVDMAENMTQKQIDRMIELMMAGKSEEEASKQAMEEIPADA